MLPSNSALILIDVQKAFHDGSWGERNNPKAEENIAQLLEAWRRTGRPVHHVHHLSLSEQGRFRRGTAGIEPLLEAMPVHGEPVYVKVVNSAFIGTHLEAHLRDVGISTLVFVGLTTNHCVSTSVRMAANLGFSCYVVEDATAAFEARTFDGALRRSDDVHVGALSDLAGEFAAVVDTESMLGMVASNEV